MCEPRHVKRRAPGIRHPWEVYGYRYRSEICTGMEQRNFSSLYSNITGMGHCGMYEVVNG